MSSTGQQPTVRLMNAAHGELLMPVVGLGTGGYGTPDGTGGEYWGPEQGHNATVEWLKAGGRRIDTSDSYASRNGIGTGWKASGVARSEIFITSKLNPSGYEGALDQFADILKSLQTDYIDLLLIHWPGSPPPRTQNAIRSYDQQPPNGTENRMQTWRALETLFEQKKVRYYFFLNLFLLAALWKSSLDEMHRLSQFQSIFKNLYIIGPCHRCKQLSSEPSIGDFLSQIQNT